MSHRFIGGLLGVILGFGAPAGSLLFRMFFVQGVGVEGILREVSANSFYYVYMTLLTPLVFGLFGSYLGLLNDKVSEQKKTYKAVAAVLANQSMTDDVTGLYNHRHILEEAEREIERAKRHDRVLCGMMVDIDDFKKVNDQYGHLTGDMVLREAAYVLGQSIRKIDIIGRYGGDEFFVILPETSHQGAKVVAERVRERVRRYRFMTKSGYLSLTVSLGLASFEDVKGLIPALFVEKADEALLKAKSLGKDQVLSHDFISEERK